MSDRRTYFATSGLGENTLKASSVLVFSSKAKIIGGDYLRWH